MHLLASMPIRPSAVVCAVQGLHGVAYTGALARPLVCPEQAVKGLSADKLHHFVSQNFTAPRIVVSAAGIPHKELVSLAEPLFSGLPQQQKPPQPSSTYVGGDFRCVRV